LNVFASQVLGDKTSFRQRQKSKFSEMVSEKLHFRTIEANPTVVIPPSVNTYIVNVNSEVNNNQNTLFNEGDMNTAMSPYFQSPKNTKYNNNDNRSNHTSHDNINNNNNNAFVNFNSNNSPNNNNYTNSHLYNNSNYTNKKQQSPTSSTPTSITNTSPIAIENRKLFKTQISKVVVKRLNKYFSAGKISSKTDFKHLSRHFTHSVMEREYSVGKNNISDSTKKKIKKMIDDYFQKHDSFTRKKNFG